jgi:GT2 family glycosyltransferase/glycosyltransferase involved in cell wall biosynthesis
MAELIVFPPEDAPLASVVIIGWHEAPYLLGCLRALAASAPEVSFEVLAALNEPDGSLIERLRDGVIGLTIVTSEENLGFGGVLNRAAASARGRYLVFLNDDTEVLHGWLDELVDVAERREAGAVGSRLLEHDGSVQEAGGIIWRDGWTWSVGRGLPADSSRFDFERKIDYSSASSLLVRRALFDELGGFDPSYYPAYFEDADLCMRLARGGEAVWFAPRSNVRHFESASTGGRYRDFLMARNHDRFVRSWSRALGEKEPRVAANEPAVDRAVWRAMGSRYRVLVIDDRAPDPAIGSGFPRMAQILASLQRDDDLQLYLYATVFDGAKDHDALCRLGIGVVDEPLESHLQRIGRRYDCVVISRPHNYEHLAPLVRRMTTAPIIYDAEALYSRRIALQASLATDAEDRLALEYAASEMVRVETAIAKDMDRAVCLSEDEARFFSAHGSGPVEVLPPVLEGIEPVRASFSERDGLGFVAGWLGGPDSPNVNALQWFASKVLPLVCNALPSATLFVTGANPPDSVTGLASERVQFLGNVADLADVYGRVRVIVSPMLYGAGVKNKTVEALQYGVPTVATAVGAEGIELADPEALFVSDDAKTMAGRLIQLLSDEVAWQRQTERVLTEVAVWNETFDPARWPEIVRGTIEEADTADPGVSVDGDRRTLPSTSDPAGLATEDLDLVPGAVAAVAAVSAAEAARRVREDYIGHLEAELATAEDARRAEAELREASEQHAANLGDLVQQMRTQPSYRVAQGIAQGVRRFGPLRRAAGGLRRKWRARP